MNLFSWYKPNIKRRLTFNFALLVLLMLSAFSFVIVEYYSALRESSYRERLHSNSLYIASNLLLADSAMQAEFYRSSMNTLNNLRGQRLSVLDYKNEVVAVFNQGVDLSRFDLMKVRREMDMRYIENDTQYVAFDMRKGSKRYIVLSSAYDYVGFDKKNALNKLIYILLLVSVVVVISAGYGFAVLSMKPVKQMIERIQNITGANLHLRIYIKNKDDELAMLANTFNSMLDRIENSFILEKSFVANASHEYRTPVTSMKGQIEVALMRTRTADEYKLVLTSLLEDLDGLINLHLALSELMKAQTSESSHKFTYIPVVEVIGEAQADLLKAHPEYSVELLVHEYPLNPDESVVLGDESLLKSAFKNLMDNACKFSEDHSCQVVIQFVRGEIRLDFKDNGPGISDNDLPYIFSPFYRAEELRSTEGFGIGLSIVKRIVEVHKGRINVKSTPGNTVFSVELPSSKD
jgi:two-component system sensor histidine kinase ArlS